ncbi:Mitochondrial inner membrane protease subunit [Thalictrum thalictroides]|uniref:Mitochondrial inner membrane protease subunit n=1 Tax=Thalictrum thalictroides TaxID=46969 RepID=A0A7J6UXD7_THATH|nr:Mitochondrial inner membrane protease subunit [Thalictrum thalictroides]
MNILQLPWRTIAKEAFDRTLPFVNVFCCLHFANKYICSSAHTFGPSMVPTLSLTGDLVLVDQISTRFGRIKNGDIVLVRSPVNPRKVITKRVTGMEGDQVTFLEDPNDKNSYKTVTIQEGHVWVQGDNIYASTDSRIFGAVPYGLLCGRIFFRIWPLNSFGSLSSQS